MASWVVYAFVLYIYIVGSSLYKLFYPTRWTALDLFAFAAPDARWRDPHAAQREGGAASLLFAARGLSPAVPWEHNVTLPFAAFGTRRNGTLFAHLYAYPSAGGAGDVALPGEAAALPQGATPVGYVVVPLTRHLVPRVRTAKHLLGGGDDAAAAAAAAPTAQDAAPPAEACAAAGEGGGSDAVAAAGSCASPDAPADGAATPATPAGAALAAAEEPEPEPWAGTGRTFTHIRPRVSLRIVHPSPSVMPDAFPGELSSYLVHPGDPGARGRGGPGAPPAGWPLPAGQGLLYRPLLELDELSVTKRDFRLVSALLARDDPVVPFALEPTGMGPFALYAQLGASIRTLQGSLGLSEDDTDEMKEMISGTNIRWWLLTTLVSLLHGLFSYLAFSNDVGFWRGKTSLEGLSIRTFFSSFVCQVIIFLKLLDSPSVSRIILAEVGVSVLIEGWKVSKIARRRGLFRRLLGSAGDAPPPAMSATEEETDEADARAMRWLSYGLYPCVVAWGLYSLYNHTHRSWWSWLVQTAAHGVYMWGFVAMTPQLYINYRLKSVAHLPWRALMYKTFNTFVDDVFAFAIEMPLSHRLACLRDDVVFFGYLYQRWIYPVDKSRANEYGRAYEEPAAEALPAAAAAAGADAAAAAGEGDEPQRSERSKKDE